MVSDNTETTGSGLNYLLHKAAEEHPGNIAAVDSRKTLTYKQLDLCSNAAANMLIADNEKISCGNVCIIIGSCVERLLFVAGTIKAGMTYVPFDIKAPVQRNCQIADNVSCSYILTSDINFRYASEIAEKCGCPPENVIVKTAGELMKMDTTYPDITRSAGSISYIIHTSGSTGKPKGVVIGDNALINLCDSVQKRYAHISCNDSTCALSNFSFDASVFDMFPFMMAGAAIYFIEDEEKTDVSSINRFLIRNRITMQQMTTALYHLFADLENDTLKKVFVIGEKMVKFIPRGYEVYNCYGPTEATVLVTYTKITGQALDIPIGIPIDNTEIIIVKDDSGIADTGEEGEICISGACLANGYLNNETETAKRFVPHVNDNSRLMFRTGDIGRYNDKGELFCSGRIDFQIKHRGYRIELDEIKHYVLELDRITDCAVIYNDKAENKYIVCFYCTSDNSDIPADDIRNILSRDLADYMIPARWVHLDSIPLNNNGKTDRDALLSILEKNSAASCNTADSSLGGMVKKIWARLLDIPDNFDESVSFNSLGGHSILSMIMLKKVKELTGITVSFGDFLNCDSFKEFSALLEGSAYNKSLSGFRDDPQHRFDSFGLNVMQQAYYVGRCKGISLGSVPTHLYIELDCFSFDHDKIIRVINRLFRHHDALRLRVSDDATQCILPFYEIKKEDIPYFDERKSSRDEFYARLLTSRKEMVSQSCDYSSSSLIKLRIFRDTDDHATLQLYLDGFVADGWSQEILFADFDLLYGDENALLQEQEHLFRDYVLYTNSEERLKTQDHVQSERFWKENIRHLPEIPELPLIADPTTVTKPTVKHITRSMTMEEWAEFEKCCAAQGVSTSNVMMTVFGKVIARWSRKKDLIINLPVANRFFDNVDFTDLFGLCTDFLLFDIHDRRDESLRDAVLRNQERLAVLSQNRAFSGMEVIRELSKLRGDAGNAAPVVFTSLLDIPDKKTRFIRKKYFQTHTSQIWLDAIVIKCGDGITFSWDYVEELFEDNTITAMMDTFYTGLKLLCTDSSGWDAKELDIISPVPVSLSSAKGNDVPRICKPVSQLLLSAAQKFSQRIAIYADGQEYTYGQLFDSVRACSVLLSDNHLNKGDRTVILMDKRYEQIVSVLAVVMLGGIYVPIDTINSDARIMHCIKDTEARIIISDTRELNKYGTGIPDKCTVINVDKADLSSYTGSIEYPQISCDDLYCIIYTSGSTGNPKGVMLRQRGLHNCIEFTSGMLELTPDDKILSLTNLCHDMSIYDIFGMLCKGCSVVLPDKDRIKDPAHWADIINRYHVTIWNSVPAIMEMQLEMLEFSGDSNISSLRAVILGGDVLSPNMPVRIKHFAPSAAVYNVGGPTETTIWSVYHKVEDADLTRVRIPLGKAIDNVTYMILDSNLQICPYDVAGNIYVEGVSLSSGYLNYGDKNNESFILDPYTQKTMYNTGDIGKYLKNGEIDILGRDDFQVKLNGKRIELTEIESAAVHDKRIDAAVAVCDSHKKMLTLYYRTNSPINKKELQSYLEKVLPEYMVPARYMEVSGFTLSNNGKIDRSKLPEIQDNPEENSECGTDPTEISDVLNVYREILGRDDISPDDNFFKCGGDSLKAIKLLYALNKKTGISLKLTDIFIYSGIRNMQLHIKSLKGSDKLNV
ncbi:MAG: amino acid adenylation domain-containing protein [Oscillospiraceae bacterium]|nr:amino acid adenylation domain-containing protein [Oscillospiraceae bacterium]